MRFICSHWGVLGRAFRVAVERGKAIFATQAERGLSGIVWVQALTGEMGYPIESLNQYCLEHRVNGICLTRYPIHLFGGKGAGAAAPHNSGSVVRWRVVVESG